MVNKFVLLFSFCMLAILVNGQNTVYYTKYKTWTPELEEIAKSGTDIMAIVSLGSCYDRADGVTQDRQKAFELFQQAAAKGDVLAKYNLGLYYSRGYCGNVDNSLAVSLFEAALKMDEKFTPAYIQLALIYEKGVTGIEKDAEKAFWAWEQAANLGDPIGQYSVGRYYWQGIGRQRDLSKAKDFYEKAATQGDPNAMDNLASCYMEEKNFSAAAYWLQKAFDKGAMYVCHNLGDLYYYGNGVEQSYEKAYHFFQVGSSSNPRCKYRMAVMLFNGEGVSVDKSRALTLLKEAAEAGIDKAQYQMGVYYYSGNIVPQDYVRAVKLFIQALESQYLLDDVRGDICQHLSKCYRFGRGIEKSESKADEYSKMAASYGDVDAKKISEWLKIK